MTLVYYLATYPVPILMPTRPAGVLRVPSLQRRWRGCLRHRLVTLQGLTSLFVVVTKHFTPQCGRLFIYI